MSPKKATGGFDTSDEEDNGVDNGPLAIDWLDLSSYGCSADLGISALPGCRFKDTWRDLGRDVAQLKKEGIQDVFVLCTRGELNKYRVPSLLTELSEADLTMHHYPFPDGSAPPTGALFKMLEELRVTLLAGRKCLVHCFGGLGRSCCVAVCLLQLLNEEMEPSAAVDTLRQLRGPAAIHSVKQFNFVHDFRKTLAECEKTVSEPALRSVSR